MSFEVISLRSSSLPIHEIMKSNKIEPKFVTKFNPRIGLIALATDFMIEKDFIKVIKDKEIDFFVNRIECYNPLTKENLIRMSEEVTKVTSDILPNEEIDCIVYGCTSGTIAAGFESIEKKVKAAKPMADVTTPSSAAIKALSSSEYARTTAAKRKSTRAGKQFSRQPKSIARKTRKYRT